MERGPELRVAEDGSFVEEAERVVAFVQSAAWLDDEVLDERVVGAEWLPLVSLDEVKALMQTRCLPVFARALLVAELEPSEPVVNRAGSLNRPAGSVFRSSCRSCSTAIMISLNLCNSVCTLSSVV